LAAQVFDKALIRACWPQAGPRRPALRLAVRTRQVLLLLLAAQRAHHAGPAQVRLQLLRLRRRSEAAACAAARRW